tara:strand:- start:190 stop:792 length:603 start_codon:yes stop_codon:yes gene_type:complete
MDNQFKFYYWGPFLYHTKIKNDECSLLLAHSKKIKNTYKLKQDKKYKNKLTGIIKEEYSLDNSVFHNAIKPYILNYLEKAKHFYNKDISHEVITDGVWVNFMRAGDFNPPHNHDGDLSCVLFIDVPKKLKEEYDNHTSPATGPGSLNFQYGERKNLLTTDLNFFPEAGDFFIFPSHLIHWVFPFKSNGERISIAANFLLK